MDDKYYHDFLEDMKWIEENYPHFDREYQPSQED
jgi:hypothetical protein